MGEKKYYFTLVNHFKISDTKFKSTDNTGPCSSCSANAVNHG